MLLFLASVAAVAAAAYAWTSWARAGESKHGNIQGAAPIEGGASPSGGQGVGPGCSQGGNDDGCDGDGGD
jgi:hypothetical protein